MQDTRLTRLLDGAGDRLTLWFANPWRKLSVQIISLLGGFFMGSAVAAIAGQKALLDTTVAGILLVGTEIISWLFYRNRNQKMLLLELINIAKWGFIYCLFLEAFKLGS